jgi:two-component system sensor kinase FixL
MHSFRSDSSSKKTDLLSAILVSAVDSIIVIDRSGTIRNVNPATERLFGFVANELVGSNIKVLMPPPFRGEHDGYLSRYHQTGEPQIIGIGREVMGRRKDGTDFPIHLAVSEFQVDGETHYAGIIRDISDLKRTEEELQKLNDVLETRVQERTDELRKAQSDLVAKEKLAMLGRVSGGIAHEIRNPLNALKTSAYFLLNASTATPEKVTEHLQRIDRQVDVIESVVTALSDVARLPHSELVPCDLHSILDNAIGSVSKLSDIQIEFPELLKPAMVQADPNQLLIVFRNLIRNARDAVLAKEPHARNSAEDRRVTVTVEIGEGTSFVMISDTGVGIEPDQLEKILDPFFSTKARGMGLGLAISNTMIQRNGGQIRVSSQPGRGSTFTVELVSASLEKLP